jgi:hypothetical protein
VAKYDEMDPDFEYVLRITKLRAKDTSHDDHMDTLRQWIAADAAAAKEAKPAPKRKAARPKGKAK